jgi:hypothetical protein
MRSGKRLSISYDMYMPRARSTMLVAFAEMKKLDA